MEVPGHHLKINIKCKASVVPTTTWLGLQVNPDRGRADYCALVSIGSVFSFLYEELEGL